MALTHTHTNTHRKCSRIFSSLRRCFISTFNDYMDITRTGQASVQSTSIFYETFTFCNDKTSVQICSIHLFFMLFALFLSLRSLRPLSLFVILSPNMIQLMVVYIDTHAHTFQWIQSGRNKILERLSTSQQ